MQKTIAIGLILVGLTAIVGGAYFGKTQNVVPCSKDLLLREDSCMEKDYIFQVCRRGKLDDNSGCSALKMNTAFQMAVFGGVGAVVVGGFWLAMITTAEYRKTKKVVNTYDEGL